MLKVCVVIKRQVRILGTEKMEYAGTTSEAGIELASSPPRLETNEAETVQTDVVLEMFSEGCSGLSLP
jgi:hypothetical protein